MVADWICIIFTHWEGGGTDKLVFGGPKKVLLGGIEKLLLGGTEKVLLGDTEKALCTYLQPSRWEQRCLTAGDHIGPTLVLHYDQPGPANVHKNIHLSTHDHINSTKPEIIWTQTPNILVGTSQAMFWSDKASMIYAAGLPWGDSTSLGDRSSVFWHTVSFCWCLSLAVWIILPLT